MPDRTRRPASAARLTLLAAAATLATPLPALAAPSAATLKERLKHHLREEAREAGAQQDRAAEPLVNGAATTRHAAGEVIVTFAKGATAEQRRAAVAAVDGKVAGELGTPRQVLVTLPSAVPTGEGRDVLERQEGVADAALNVPVELYGVPNDPLLKEQYGLYSPAAGGFASPDADIEAAAAWDQTTGSTAVTVALIDTGMDLDHPALSPQIAYNAGERGNGKETNGVDDDNNGYVDDWRGWDTGNDDNDPSPYATGGMVSLHGTHVAGIIGARGNDGHGTTGVAQNIRILPTQMQAGGWLGAIAGMPFVMGDFFVDDLIEAIHYAGKRGVDIANMSLGVTDPAVVESLQAAVGAYPNTLFVVAAGNSTSDNDGMANPPCTLPLANILCVGSTNDRGRLSSYSSFGKTTVDLFAPGERVMSSVPYGEFGELSGTSMASPVVAGAAAVYKSKYPTATVAQVKAALMSTTDPIKGAAAKSVTGGRLNLARALNGAPARPTASISLSGGVLRYTGSGTTPHSATVRTEGTEVVIEARASTTISAPCGVRPGQGVICPADQVTSLEFTGSTGDDRFVNDTDLTATFNGGGGNDTLLGGSADDTLNGGEGDDTLQGFGGGDTLNGNGGTDTVTYGERDAADEVYVTLDGQRNDGVGTEGDLVATDVEGVIGHIGPDDLSGSANADRLYGIGGNDVLNGKGGNDIIDGGQGTDRALYYESSSAVEVNLGAPAPQATGGDGSDTLSAIEGVLGSRFNDTLTGDAGANILDGGFGTDRLDGGAGADWFEATFAAKLAIDLRATGAQAAGATGLKTLVGIENVRGTNGADTLIGNAGNNVLAPGLGDDTVDGLDGADTISYAAGGLIAQAPNGVTVNLGTTAAQNTVTAGSETVRNVEAVQDSPGRDVITGSEGDDVIQVSAGDLDKVDGRGGSDHVDLSGRRTILKDTFTITSASDPASPVIGSVSTVGLKNVEAVSGTTGSDTFVSGPGDETFVGGTGTDTLSYAGATAGVRMSIATAVSQDTGAAGWDQVLGIENLIGSPFNDVLTGNNRRNVITPGKGSDRVDAGANSDLIKANDKESDTLACGTGDDWIWEDDAALDVVDASCEPNLRWSQERFNNG